MIAARQAVLMLVIGAMIFSSIGLVVESSHTIAVGCVFGLVGIAEALLAISHK